ncbi:bifunctional adenosylcobinamide kinase/adenosylcobinamide-phosphate guanylyltransferase [Undibacterium sp.]|uniref:bifunctional adenosylcobinamide kinase/adenosylcobinamide-phosphate guanylyltransferase n=1 Tax=Undibacterium sp. TaxID=1914977 RepID=UPI002C5DF174|nr:bifunctional adenosylcobinamide kinase/adenosylcobinamide-phosphate guanylyltransferase [Undibacterium sp.]HTD02964.1 bifunctional adenosylcobinamide kinase/adenosylcobinamide-phosphate guanylyltransferase [Undibacterium sp.]
MTRTLVFGGARSGKSAYAEKLAAQSGKRVVYIATAQAGDAEMQTRIALHRQQRPADWITVEQTVELAGAIRQHAAPDTLILVDCLTVWLSNLLFSGQRDYPEVGTIIPPDSFAQQRAPLLEVLQEVQNAQGEVILVSNEVGMGIVPQGAISRWFVDEAGRLNQAVAAACDRVFWIAAGLPLALKS